MSLYDRNYMHNDHQQEDYSNRNIIWILIAVNAVIFFFIAPPGSSTAGKLALWCSPQAFNVWQIVTAGFLHADFQHILFNMWGLYLFGSLVKPYMSSRNFFLLYMAGVLSGNLLFLASSWGKVNILMGASGAVCAIMMAAAMLEPEKRFVMLFMPFAPIKTSTMVICYTILEVILQYSGAQSSVAHLAHLGGFAGGYILIKALFKNQVAWDPFRRKKSPRASTGKPFFTSAPPPPAADSDAPVSPAELDYLLDKISREGINNLSEQELAKLRRARQDMRPR